LEAGLGWITKLNKGDFIGKPMISKVKQEGLKRRLVGFNLSEKAVARHGYPLASKGVEVGHVTSGTFSPSLERAIGLGYVAVGSDEVGKSIQVVIRGKEVGASIVNLPFVHK
jgi:aminomethyltransferase